MTYKELIEELLDELDTTVYWLRPTLSDYHNQGIAETMVLDAKIEICNKLTDIIEKYYDKYDKLEE